jgi:Macro domain
MDSNKSCFVIMPFGIKNDHEGNKVNFNEIYASIIKPAIEELDLACLRCDEISKAGMIHKDMFNHIYHSDIAIVDISVLNPNVFYELGMRHSLKKSITVIIKRKNTQIPFNITGMRLIEYDEENVESRIRTKLEIQAFIKNGLRDRQIDSPIFDSIENLTVRTKEILIKKSERIDYKINDKSSKIIGIITGSIDKIKDIDIWVNSENTNMQMAKYYSGSISGRIRYLGAKKDVTKNIVEDTIQNELEELMGIHSSVNSGVVIPTGAGDLEKTHNVKKIFHAAGVTGQIGRGYAPIIEVERCVREALVLAEDYPDLNSILIPFIGTGSEKGDFEITIPLLIEAAINYMIENPECSMEKIYFIEIMKSKFELAKNTLSKILG